MPYVFNDACIAVQCNHMHQCVFDHVLAGISCDDHDARTYNDHCDNIGQCVGDECTTANDCGESPVCSIYECSASQQSGKFLF